MIHSKIDRILEQIVAGDEELEKKSDHFSKIRRDVDIRAQAQDADLEKVLRRAKELIENLFGTNFVSNNWKKIEDELKENLKELKN